MHKIKEIILRGQQSQELAYCPVGLIRLLLDVPWLCLLQNREQQVFCAAIFVRKTVGSNLKVHYNYRERA